MKKFFLLCCTLLATTFFVHAQNKGYVADEIGSNEEVSFDFSEGFSYFDRALSSSTINIVARGVQGEADVHLTGAIMMPKVAGISITGIEFLAITSNPKGVIYVGSRAANSNDDFVIETKKEVTDIKNYEVSRYDFPTPITTVEGKEYIVGYEVVSTDNITYEGELSPIVGFEDPLSMPEANLVAYNRDGSNIGSSVKLDDMSPMMMGNLAIVALYKDPSNKIAHAALFTKHEQRRITAQGTEMPADKLHLQLPIKNMHKAAISHLTLRITLPDGSESTKDYAVTDDVVDIQLGKISTYGESKATIRIVKVDGAANAIVKENYISVIQPFKLYDPSKVFLRNAVLVEKYVSEKCPVTPVGNKRMDDAIKESNVPVVIAAHHTGYNPDYTTLSALRDDEEPDDFLTLPGDKDFLEDCILPSGDDYDNFTPAMVINRSSNTDMTYLNTLGYSIEGMFILPGEPADVVKMLQFAKEEPAEAIIDKVTKQKEGNQYEITVTGRCLSDYAQKDLFLTIYRTESGIPSQNQQGADKNYVHNNVIRAFVTPIKGQRITCKSDGTFQVTVKNILEEESWNKGNMQYVIFIHRNPENSEYGNRYVYNAVGMPLTAASGVCKVSAEDAPKAYVQNGMIRIEGHYDNVAVYSINGEQVKNINSPLAKGVYIVRIQLGDSLFNSKVLVP